MAILRVPVQLQWNGPGAPGVNVYSLRVADDPTGITTQIDAALLALKTFYEGIDDLWPVGYSASCGADIFDRQTLQEYARPGWTVNAPGGAGMDASVVQLVAGWRTTLRARRGRGRTFVGPLHDGMTDANGTPNSSAIGTLKAAADALVAASTAGGTGWGFGVWGLQNPTDKSAGAPPAAKQPHVHRDFTGVRVRDSFAVLRSRRD